MNTDSKIIITGAFGFIGSCLVSFLNKKGFQNLILVDDFSKTYKAKNLEGKKYALKIDRNELSNWLKDETNDADYMIHLGARTDTTEMNYEIHNELNVEFSKSLWLICSNRNIPIIYASSAATYGDGKLGYKDDASLSFELQPLNPYGISKNEFDKWAIQQTSHPPFWAGLKFFNIFGPNEYHKGRMASVVFHSYNHIKEHQFVQLFKSHNLEYEDGCQIRDFVYVEDLLNIIFIMMTKNPTSGIYNLGTGKARTFIDLVTPIFEVLELKCDIRFIDMPLDIRDKYQYYTQADMSKTITAIGDYKFMPLEDTVKDYVKKYLMQGVYY
jgi:ADP-L-glycero-D-manno-heptose 6-epimerase